MKSIRYPAFCVFLALFLRTGNAFGQGAYPLQGTWDLVPGQSTDIDHFGALTLDVSASGDSLTIQKIWGRGRTFRESVTLVPGAPPVDVPVRSWVFPSNIFMGVRLREGDMRRVAAVREGENQLRVDENYAVHGSQGLARVKSVHRYEVTDGGDILLYRVDRSSRTSGPPVKYVLKRRGTRRAYVVRLDDDWSVAGGLSVNAMMISLQGLANRTGPLLYLKYPDDWPFTYVNSVFDFYSTKRFYSFTQLKTPAGALQSLGSCAKGFVVWDTAVRTSLIVAFTAAGLEDGIVVSEKEIPLAEKAGLRPLEDLRGKFRGMNDAQIYAWAAGKYWGRCSREFIVWVGGEHGTIM
jgi:hypothetical protein